MTNEELQAIDAKIAEAEGHWKVEDCGAETSAAVIDLVTEDAAKLVAEVRRLQKALNTAEEDERDLEAVAERYRSHLIAIRKIAEGDV